LGTKGAQAASQPDEASDRQGRVSRIELALDLPFVGHQGRPKGTGPRKTRDGLLEGEPALVGIAERHVRRHHVLHRSGKGGGVARTQRGTRGRGGERHRDAGPGAAPIRGAGGPRAKVSTIGRARGRAIRHEHGENIALGASSKMAASRDLGLSFGSMLGARTVRWLPCSVLLLLCLAAGCRDRHRAMLEPPRDAPPWESAYADAFNDDYTRQS